MKKILLSFVAALLALPALANDDFGVWSSIELEKRLTRQFSISGELDFRAENELQAASRWGGTIGFTFKPSKYFKMSTGYAYLWDHNCQEDKVNYTSKGKVNGWNVDHSYWRSKHRFFFDVTGRLPIGRLSISLRERYQYTHKQSVDVTRDRYRDEVQAGYSGERYAWNGTDYTDFEQTSRHKNRSDVEMLKSRLSVSYNIAHCPLEPFASFEISNDLRHQMHLDANRLSVGSEWKINKKNRISCAYVYQSSNNEDGNDGINVVQVGYKLIF